MLCAIGFFLWIFKSNNKILDITKSKAFADDKLNVSKTKMTISLFDKVKNTVGKGENAGYHHFLLFPQCFPSSSGYLKSRDCVVKS